MRLVWVPPFIAGAVAATAAELAAGLLLYSALGFLRALTVVLAVEMGAFGLGLWSAAGTRAGSEEQARRAWLFCLVAYSAAAALTAAWRLLGDLGANALTQGLGLALLGGLPMFAVAALLGSLGSGASGRSVGSSAAMGASAGLLVTGFLLVPALEPSSILLVCVIALSGGALLHGWIHAPAAAGPQPTSSLDGAPPGGAPPPADEFLEAPPDEHASAPVVRRPGPPDDPVVEPSSAS
jgi:hypothetical protein